VQDFKDPVRSTQSHHQRGDGIACAPDVECGIPVSYYLQADPVPPDPTQTRQDDSRGTTARTFQSHLPSYLKYAGHDHRIFFIFGPLRTAQAPVSRASEWEAALTADGFRLSTSSKATAQPSTRQSTFTTAPQGARRLKLEGAEPAKHRQRRAAADTSSSNCQAGLAKRVRSGAALSQMLDGALIPSLSWPGSYMEQYLP
jgi:hypothetical protein